MPLRVERLRVVADERRRVQRGAMILAAERRRDRAATAGTPCSCRRGTSARGSRTTTGVVLTSRSRRHSQFAFGAPKKSTSCSCLLASSFTPTMPLPSRRVSGSNCASPVPRIDAAFGIDRRAAAAPQAAAGGNERAGAARGEIERVERVGQAAAALRRGGVDDAVVQVERVRLAAARDELLGRRDVLAVRQVDLAQPAIPRHGVDRVLPGRRLRHRRHRGLAAGAERVVRAARIGERAVEAPVPDLLAGRDVDAEQVVGDAGDDGRARACPARVVTRSAMSGANRLCIARGVLSSFSFHSSFDAARRWPW